MTPIGHQPKRGKLCRSCHQMRDGKYFVWEHEGERYCSRLCVQREQRRIPYPREGED